MPLPYTYTANVPQSTQQINNSQQSINYNFQDIATLLSVNHVGFNTADTFGTHNFVNFVTQSTDPSTASAEMALYTKAVSGDTNNVEFFYRYPDNGSVLQLTGSTASSGSTGSGGGLFYYNNGIVAGYPRIGSWQYLSNGILMMTWQVFNVITSTGNGSSSPITIYIPNSTNSYTTEGSSTMPTFTSSIYNMQFGITNENALTSWNNGQWSNAALSIVDTTTALLYLPGTGDILDLGNQGAICITAIGI